MKNLGYLSPALAVAGAMTASDFDAAARLGFKTIINNRPDGEEPGQLSAREEAVLAWRAGIAYRFVPAAKHEVLDDHVLEPMRVALTSVHGPVLLHCRSGLRSAIMWAALAAAAGAPVDEVIAHAKAAGQDLEPVRDEIAAHADAAKTEYVGFEAASQRPTQAAA